jgi:nucleotide-binding universal stress UspA family protein
MTEADPGHPKPSAGPDGALTLVVGVDGSDTSWHAAAYAVGFARRQAVNSRIVFVYVKPNPGLNALVPQVMPAARESVQQTLADITATLQRGLPDLEWEIRSGTGSAFRELKRIATAVRADTVVIGASSRLGHRVVGSIAARLVKTRLWPVIVVP